MDKEGDGYKYLSEFSRDSKIKEGVFIKFDIRNVICDSFFKGSQPKGIRDMEIVCKSNKRICRQQ